MSPSLSMNDCHTCDVNWSHLSETSSAEISLCDYYRNTFWNSTLPISYSVNRARKQNLKENLSGCHQNSTEEFKVGVVCILPVGLWYALCTDFMSMFCWTTECPLKLDLNQDFTLRSWWVFVILGVSSVLGSMRTCNKGICVGGGNLSLLRGAQSWHRWVT